MIPPWMKDTLLLKKQGKSWEFPVTHFVTGINWVRLILLELQPEYACTINKTYFGLLASIYLLRKRGRLHTVELARGSKKMTWTDKKLFSEPNSLITKWFQTSALELIGNAKVLTPFWNRQSKEISRQLWLPTETDFQGSHSTLSKTYLLPSTQNSLFSTRMNKNLNPVNLQTIFSQSFTSTPAGPMVEEDIRARKIRLYPNKTQVQTLLKWMGVCRYVYNHALASIKRGENKYNFQQLRNEFVTHKRAGVINDKVHDWMLEVPKDIRAGALRDLVKGFSSSLALLKSGHIKYFRMRYREKRKDASMEIPKSAISIGKKLSIYNTYLSLIKMSKDKCLKNIEITHDCRLKKEGVRWYIIVPCAVSTKKTDVSEVCSIDPGCRNFQTIYSGNRVTRVVPTKEVVQKLQKQLDLLRSLRDKGIVRKRRKDKRWDRLSDLTSDMHNKTISYLFKHHNTILIPRFESQEIGRSMSSRKNRRSLFTLKHYQFLTRLIDKSKIIQGTQVIVCKEDYTSKTCGWCGIINKKLGGSDIFDCKFCGLVIDRDMHAARNILIKWLTEKK